jgi:hypothetical protein
MTIGPIKRTKSYVALQRAAKAASANSRSANFVLGSEHDAAKKLKKKAKRLRAEADAEHKRRTSPRGHY